MSTDQNQAFYLGVFKSFDINQSESNFIYRGAFKNFDTNQYETSFYLS